MSSANSAFSASAEPDVYSNEVFWFAKLRRSDLCTPAAPPELRGNSPRKCYKHAAPPELRTPMISRKSKDQPVQNVGNDKSIKPGVSAVASTPGFMLVPAARAITPGPVRANMRVMTRLYAIAAYRGLISSKIWGMKRSGTLGCRCLLIRCVRSLVQRVVLWERLGLGTGQTKVRPTV